MNKKGFTLIELLAVVVVLGIISVMVLPQISGGMNSKKQAQYDKYKEVIISAAKSYYSNNKDSTNIPVSTLVEERYMDYIKNPIDNTDMNGCVNITKVDGINTYTYVDNACPPVSFATDSWDTIQAAVQSGTYPYQVGDTKCVALNGFTTTNNNGCGEAGIAHSGFKVRVANTSTPSECNGSDFSQSACGFVLEFVDIIKYYSMLRNVDTNVGGWPASAMYKQLNPVGGDSDSGLIYNALPSELKNIIIDTRTISGYGSTTGETNFISTDKLYLLSTHEVWNDIRGNQISDKDTAYANTRQLDYYSTNGVTTSNYTGAIKQYNGSDYFWWLRTANSANNYTFMAVYKSGEYSAPIAVARLAGSVYGLSPAFRIG